MKPNGMWTKAIAMAALCAGLAAGAQDVIEEPLAKLPLREALPNPFEFLDGSPVLNEGDWVRRRDEMMAVLLTYEYGHVPPAPGNVVLDAVDLEESSADGKIRSRHLHLKFGPNQELKMNVEFHAPADIVNPVPVIVRVGLKCPDLEGTIARGFAFAGFEYQDLDPDTEGYDEDGPAQVAYPEYDWGTLAVWAWGASRVLDYLEGVPTVDTERSVVTGHSRTGKAALLAGAMDTRFAVVVPNGSGCGGASVYRIANEGAETLELITQPKRFAAWFHDDFHRFSDQETRLPFDQHFLRALVAPRGMMDTEALDDRWANLWGAQAGYLAAQPVFDWLGVPHRNGIHFRDGKHDQLPEDFAALLDFASAIFAKEDPGEGFRKTPFAEVELDLDWTLPEK